MWGTCRRVRASGCRAKGQDEPGDLGSAADTGQPGSARMLAPKRWSGQDWDRAGVSTARLQQRAVQRETQAGSGPASTWYSAGDGSCSRLAMAVTPAVRLGGEHKSLQHPLAVQSAGAADAWQEPAPGAGPHRMSCQEVEAALGGHTASRKLPSSCGAPPALVLATIVKYSSWSLTSM